MFFLVLFRVSYTNEVLVFVHRSMYSTHSSYLLTTDNNTHRQDETACISGTAGIQGARERRDKVCFFLFPFHVYYTNEVFSF